MHDFIKMPLFGNQNRNTYYVCNGELPNNHLLGFDPNFNKIPKHMVFINVPCHAKFNALVCSSLFLEKKSTKFEFSQPLSFFIKLKGSCSNFHP